MMMMIDKHLDDLDDLVDKDEHLDDFDDIRGSAPQYHYD